jgi:excisionase family DNA binding protein
MGGMFYSLQEVAEKLNIPTDEVEQIVKEGRLREFRGGPTVLFKADEVEALAVEGGFGPEAPPAAADDELAFLTDDSGADLAAFDDAQQDTPPQEPAEEIELAEVPEEVTFQLDETASLETDDAGVKEFDDILLDDSEEKPAEAAESTPQPADDDEDFLSLMETGQNSVGDLTEGDTFLSDDSVKDIGAPDGSTKNVELGAEEDFLSVADTGAETVAATGTEFDLGTALDSAQGESLENIEDDVNLDSFGSGSGLLDLSLQADDTSLGGILDEIYTSEGDENADGAGALDVAAEADQLMPDQFAAPQPGMVAQAFEPEPDAVSKAIGIVLFLPLLAMVYTAIVLVSGFSFGTPAALKGIQAYIWYVAGGLTAVSLIIIAIAAMTGGPAGEKKPKAPKAKKEKKPKKVKKKKEKKPKAKK